jgi:hypothetical protein
MILIGIVLFTVNKRNYKKQKNLQREKKKKEEEKRKLEEQVRKERKLEYDKKLEYIKSRGVAFSYPPDYGEIEDIYQFCKLIDKGQFELAVDMFSNATKKFRQGQVNSIHLPTVNKTMSEGLLETRLIVQDFSPYEKRCAFAYGKEFIQAVVIPWYVIVESGLAGLRRGQLLSAAVEKQNDIWVAREIEIQQPHFEPKSRIFGA